MDFFNYKPETANNKPNDPFKNANLLIEKMRTRWCDTYNQLAVRNYVEEGRPFHCEIKWKHSSATASGNGLEEI